MLDTLVQQIANGLVSGAIYVLIALGLTIMFGVLDIPNFAHGQIYMLGGYTAYFVSTRAGLPFIAGLLAAMAVTAMLGVGVERLFFRPLRDAPHLSLMIAALASSMLLQNLAVLAFGDTVRSIPFQWGDLQVHIGSVFLSAQRVLILLVCLVSIAALQFVLTWTKPGRALRALADDRFTTSLMGVNIDRLTTWAFALGSAFAGVAGALLGTMFSISPGMGDAPVLTAFVVIVLGGLGSVVGAIIGGIGLGLVESLGGGFISSHYQNTIAFSLLILILTIKPSGLFGRTGVRH